MSRQMSRIVTFQDVLHAVQSEVTMTTAVWPSCHTHSLRGWGRGQLLPPVRSTFTTFTFTEHSNTATHDTVNSEFIRRVSKETSHKRFKTILKKKYNYSISTRKLRYM